MTTNILQKSIATDLNKLFTHTKMQNSAGQLRQVQIYEQDLPVRLSEDDTPPEAYVVVRLMSGAIASEQDKELVQVVLLICVHDSDINRQGYHDALHIKNMIVHHFTVHDIVGKKFQVQYPIAWELQDGDTHPFYYAGVALQIEAPVNRKETEV